MKSTGRLLSQSALISGYSFLGSALGIVVHMVFAASLGTSHAMDVFMAVIALPSAVGFLAQRLTTQILVPRFYANISAQGRERTMRGIGGLLAWAVVGSLALALAIVANAGVIRDWLVPAASVTPEDCALWFGVAGVAMALDVARAFVAAICLAQQRFALFYLPPLLKHAALIVGVWLFFPAHGIWALVLAWVVGSGLSFLVMVPAGWNDGLLGLPDVSATGSRDLVQALLPVGLAMAIVELRIPLERAFAAGLSSGSISALSYADKVIVAAYSIWPMSINVASLNAYSMVGVEGSEGDALRNEVRRSLEAVWMIALPMACALAWLAPAAIGLLFERNQFTSQDTFQVARLVRAYLGGFVGMSLAPVFGNALLCLRAPWRYARMEAAALATFLVAVAVLIPRLDAAGIAAATSLAALIRTGWGIWELKRECPSCLPVDALPQMCRAIVACALLGLALWGWTAFLPNAQLSTVVGRVASLGMATLLGLVVYAGTMAALGQRLAGLTLRARSRRASR